MRVAEGEQLCAVERVDVIEATDDDAPAAGDAAAEAVAPAPDA